MSKSRFSFSSRPDRDISADLDAEIRFFQDQKWSMCDDCGAHHLELDNHNTCENCAWWRNNRNFHLDKSTRNMKA